MPKFDGWQWQLCYGTLWSNAGAFRNRVSLSFSFKEIKKNYKSMRCTRFARSPCPQVRKSSARLFTIVQYITSHLRF
jgi:hypothetical protein